MIIGNQINRSDIAGVVVLYNSTEQVFDNIKTYLDQIDFLYIVDNSDNLTIDINLLVEETLPVRYLVNDGNKGVAYALNIASKAALKDGYSYLLTMDDDSKAPVDMIKNMIDFLTLSPISKKIAIVSAAHSKCTFGQIYKSVPYTMTSGNLLNLDIYQIIGGYNDSFFIDHVDHEFNLKIRNAGFEIIELCYVKLEHKLGTVKNLFFFGRTISYVSHSPLRFYYFIRNGLYVINKFGLTNPKSIFKITWLLVKEVLKTIFFEDNKRDRFHYLLRALVDGSKGNLGKITNE